MTASPLIGITTSFEPSKEVQTLRRTYGMAIEHAGGLPVLLSLLTSPSSVRDLASRLDGLVIPGGPSITKGMSGQLPPELPDTPPERLRFDEEMARAFLASDKPVLGICYGMQLLNAIGGGTIFGDVEHELESAVVHSHRRGADTHPIRIEAGSTLGEIIGRSEATVNSRHLQAVRDIAPEYSISARAPDGVVEAIESEQGRIIGVQFHPELMGESMGGLFRHLVRRAARG